VNAESPTSEARRVRVLVAKLGLDGHDRGAKVVAHALRDAGLEVIYSGLRRTATEVALMAVDEDVDVVGLSILSGAHLGLVRQVYDEFAKLGPDVTKPVVVGGTISAKDGAILREMGVSDVFPVRTPLDELAPRVLAAASGGTQ
jgi:methylmalonyl-CoA mutase C-terminal domain/subunit